MTTLDLWEQLSFETRRLICVSASKGEALAVRLNHEQCQELVDAGICVWLGSGLMSTDRGIDLWRFIEDFLRFLNAE